MKEISETKTQAETRAEKVEMLQSVSGVTIPGLVKYTSLRIPVKQVESMSLVDLDELTFTKEYDSVRVQPTSGVEY